MDNVELDAKQVDELLKKLEEKVPDELYQELVKSAEIIERNAKRDVPVVTGRLQSSIGIEQDDEDMLVDVGTNVDYAKSVEYNKPYLINNARNEHKALIQRLQKLIGKVVK